MNCDIAEIKRYVATKVSKKRWQHSERVAEWADDLARYHAVDRSAVAVAAYLHDVAKQLTFQEMINLIKADGVPIDPLFYDMPQIVHAVAGALLAERVFAIDDQRILNAIRYHTTGHPAMGAVEAVIYIADATEKGRDYPKLKAHRRLAKQSLKGALRQISGDTIRYLIAQDKLIHPHTLALYNTLLKDERN